VEKEEIRKQRAAVAKESDIKKQDAVVDAKEITPEEFSEMRQKVMQSTSGDPLTEEERNQYDKHALRHTYRYWEKKIDRKFVKKYSKEKVKSAYRNLSAIARASTADESLKLLRDEEMDRREIIGKLSADIEQKESKDLQRRYTYSLHEKMHSTLRIIGFEDLSADYTISYERVYERITKNIESYENNIKYLCEQLGIRKPAKRFFQVPDLTETTLEDAIKRADLMKTDKPNLSMEQRIHKLKHDKMIAFTTGLLKVTSTILTHIYDSKVKLVNGIAGLIKSKMYYTLNDQLNGRSVPDDIPVIFEKDVEVADLTYADGTNVDTKSGEG
jgi:hypothetical protein